MVEKKPIWPREFHGIDLHRVDLDLYRLLGAFFASKHFREAAQEPIEHDGISSLALEHEEGEITNTLIGIATATRIVLDGQGSARGGENVRCGFLMPSLSSRSKKEPLQVREACNKIIHATRVRFDLKSTESGDEYLSPTVYLYGKHGTHKWKAVVDIVAYARGVRNILF